MPKRQTAKSVLIIEDEADIQNFVSRTLELEGYSVYRAADGATGLEIIRNDYISLLLLDLRLPPGPDGWAILREIKRNPRLAAMPVIVLTASAEAAQRRRSLRLGAARYLVKPVSAHELIRTVRDVLKCKSKTAVIARTSLTATG
jgi:DNA-binding response OmpR family regulator